MINFARIPVGGRNDIDVLLLRLEDDHEWIDAEVAALTGKTMRLQFTPHDPLPACFLQATHLN